MPRPRSTPHAREGRITDPESDRPGNVVKQAVDAGATETSPVALEDDG
jgi:hypothetical protein